VLCQALECFAIIVEITYHWQISDSLFILIPVGVYYFIHLIECRTCHLVDKKNLTLVLCDRVYMTIVLPCWGSRLFVWLSMCSVLSKSMRTALIKDEEKHITLP